MTDDFDKRDEGEKAQTFGDVIMAIAIAVVNTNFILIQ
jgi:hypothetical protein